MKRNTKQMLRKALVGLLALTLAFGIGIPKSHAVTYNARTFYKTGDDGVDWGQSDNIRVHLTNAGHSVSNYANYGAQTIRNYHDGTRVAINIFHGLPGRMTTSRVPGGGSTWYTVSAASVVSNDNNYSLMAAFRNTGLPSLRFAYFGACHSAEGDPTYGNLTTYAVVLGAAASVGFINATDTLWGYYFDTYFFWRYAWNWSIVQCCTEAYDLARVQPPNNPFYEAPTNLHYFIAGNSQWHMFDP